VVDSGLVMGIILTSRVLTSGFVGVFEGCDAKFFCREKGAGFCGRKGRTVGAGWGSSGFFALERRAQNDGKNRQRRRTRTGNGRNRHRRKQNVFWSDPSYSVVQGQARIL